jgi:AcrR family transcriptional regulator
MVSPERPKSRAQVEGRPQVGTATNEKLADRRERLIATAIRLFSERSYEEVSVQEIAASADVAAGLLYYHFTDKQGLYAAGLERLAHQLRGDVKAATDDPSHSSPLERLLAGLKAQLEFVQRHPTVLRDLNGLAPEPKVRKIVDRQWRERLELATAALPEGVESTKTVRATIEGWLHFVDGIQIAWLKDRNLTAEQLCELCCHVLMASVSSAAKFERQTDQSR